MNEYELHPDYIPGSMTDEQALQVLTGLKVTLGRAEAKALFDSMILEAITHAYVALKEKVNSGRGPAGKWIYLQENPAESTSSHTFQCSACTCAFAINGYSQIVNFKICPSCGANMIVEDYICSYNDEEAE